MKMLYAARMARYDLLRPVSRLACKVTKWSPLCDKQLHRLVCYINSTLHYRMIGKIADPISQLDCVAYGDADFAGCIESLKSTTGGPLY